MGPGERARSRWIHAPWAVVVSQTRSHSSLSAFGAAAKRMLTGLALRWLWMLDIDMRLLCEDIVWYTFDPSKVRLLI